jgi:hypothetical protein
MPKQDLNYSKFQWHFGVVEDRNDPFNIGRVKVRFYGVHSDKLDNVSTADLPWATVIQSPMSPGTSGVGGPLIGLVEGTWVIGFFIDEAFYQKPMILGAVPGVPGEEPQENTAFNDPNLNYPRNTKGLHEIGEPDASYLSRGKKAEDHVNLKKKRASRVTKVPTAKAPSLKLQDDKPTADYENKTWDEPHPRGYDGKASEKDYGSKYPFNYVFESEKGSILELDDSLDNERIHSYHKSGTFQEIQADGSRVTKVKGKDYEIYLNGKNVQVTGDVNITVTGNVKLSVKGDKYEEIEGNHFVTIGKDKIEKIGGNHLTEILTDRSTQINGNNAMRVTGNDIRSIEKNESLQVGGTHDEQIVGNQSVTILSDRKTIVGGTDATVGAKTGDYGYANNLNMGSGKNLNIKSVEATQLLAGTTQLMNAGTTQTLTSTTQDINAETGTLDYNTGSIDVVTGNITDTNVTLHTHTHLQTGGTAPDGDGPDNKQTVAPTDGT